MNGLRTVAIDDEPLALDRLRIKLRGCEAIELVACANGYGTALDAITLHRPDLLLLDIRMRDGTAFDLLNMLPGGVTPMVAFVTAYPRYACQAFVVGALDYLLKPVDLGQLMELAHKAVRYRDMTSAQEKVAELRRVIDQLRADSSVDGRNSEDIWVRQNGTSHVRIPPSAIDWITAQEDYACIHANGREHLLRTSLDRLGELLDPVEFTRIHRSIIVRNDRIEKVCLKRVGVREVLLRGGTRLPIGRIHARNLAWRTAVPSARAILSPGEAHGR